MTVAETTMDVPQAAGSAAPRAVLLSPEDRRLMSECLQGHREAWDAFVDRFLGLFAFVVDRTAAQRGIMISSADHDDLVADILLEILHHDAAVLRGFEGRSSLATYLAVVARRVTVRGLARLGAKAPGHRVGTTHEPADGDGGQTRLADREQVAALLGQLEETEATLVRLHHLEARSYGEISRLTGIPMGSIGPMLARARQKMKLHADA